MDNIADDEWILDLEDIEKDSGRVIENMMKAKRKINGIRHKFNENDVLYSKLRTYLNKVLLADSEGYCTTEIVPITCHGSVMPQYLCHWLRSPYFLNYTLSCGYEVKMPCLSTTDAKNGIVPLSSLNQQKHIIRRINELFSLLDNISNSLRYN